MLESGYKLDENPNAKWSKQGNCIMMIKRLKEI